MRKLQNEHRNDKAKLNEEMMKLYSEHKVNPMASCLPIVAQMPVFIIMFRVLHGLTYAPKGAALPVAQTVWSAFGNEAEASRSGLHPPVPGDRLLAVQGVVQRAHDDVVRPRPVEVGGRLPSVRASALRIPYVLLVMLLGGLYFVQQRMVAARAAISPTMSQTQQKLMQYLPVFFAVFQVFFLAALVVYYLFQTLLRIAQQIYITKAFYGHDESLGRQAQRAGEAARAEAQKSGESTGMFGQAKRDLACGQGRQAKPSKAAQRQGRQRQAAKGEAAKDAAQASRPPAGASKRVTPPKNRPTPSSSAKGRPTPSRKDAQPTKSSNRPKSSGKQAVLIVSAAATVPGADTNTTNARKEQAMEWVETTAKTLDEAREAALDQLGVGADDAEFDVLEEPKPGLFGRVRGEARIRARIRPTQARPKQERKRRSRSDKPATTRRSESGGPATRDRATGVRRTSLASAADAEYRSRRVQRQQRADAKRRVPSDASTSTHQRTAPTIQQATRAGTGCESRRCRAVRCVPRRGRRCRSHVHGRPDRAFGVTGTSELTHRRHHVATERRRQRTRPARRSRWPHAERGAGSRPSRRPAPTRRPRDRACGSTSPGTASAVSRRS